MNPQDFKALLDVLNRIAKALEAEKGATAREVVNDFSVVFKRLKWITSKPWSTGETEDLLAYVAETRRIYTEVASDVLNENN